MRKVHVKLSPEAEETYLRLQKESETNKLARSLLNGINQKKELLKMDPFYGEPISKNRIPLEYKQKYGITNLAHIELPQFWRMPYSLFTHEQEDGIIVFILEIIDHPKYDKRFGYEKK